MPRLAPDSCESFRFELGTYERKKLQEIIDEERKFKITKLSVGSGIVLGAGMLAAGIGLAGYFMMPNILDEVKEKLDILKTGITNTVDSSSGKNKSVDGLDGGIATVLCVGWKDERQWTGEPSPNEGLVLVAPASGIPIIGGLSGSALYVLTFAQDKEEYVGIWGNKNKNARTIEELTQPWWYLDPKTGGPLY